MVTTSCQTPILQEEDSYELKEFYTQSNFTRLNCSSKVFDIVKSCELS